VAYKYPPEDPAVLQEFAMVREKAADELLVLQIPGRERYAEA